MTNAIVVLCTYASQDEALKIAGALVEQRLAACVNVLPAVQSVYRWQGAIEISDEVLIIVKTTQERFPALRDRISELHSYQTPEIVALSVTDGSEKYLSWVREQV